MVDRMLKAFDLLKNAPLNAKADTPRDKRERLAACGQLADLITQVSLR